MWDAIIRRRPLWIRVLPILLGSSRTAGWLLVIPALWGIVGGSAALLFGVPQDYGLIAAFLLVLAFATAYWLGASFAPCNVAANSRP